MRLRMDFQGSALSLFGYTILAVLLAYLFFIPLAWGYAMMFAFIARNTRLSDGSGVMFLGKGGDIWWILLLLILPFLVPMGIVMSDPNQPPGTLYFITLLIAMAISLYFSFLLMKWIIDSVQFSWGGRLTFQGGFLGVLGWMFLTYISAFLIILPAWVGSAFIRWICNNTTSSTGDRLVWAGSGWGLLWRLVVVYAASIFIIPIPWIMKWYLQWFISCIEVERPMGAGGMQPQQQGYYAQPAPQQYYQQ